MTARGPGEDELFDTTVVNPRNDAAPGDGEVTFEVRVIHGADRGKVLVLDASLPTRVLVGTSPTCELCLTDRQVSRRHASLEIIGARLRVLDLESTNGTFIGELAIRGADLGGGELVRIGSTTLSVSRGPTLPVQPLPQRDHFGRTVGASSEMRRLYPVCERLAVSSVPLVIEGETGTGKEVLAESLHDQGPRARGPFIVFDCTAVPPNLVESELFGHERGAFTGAVAGRRGVFEQAHGGTLLIDEIGDLDLALQPKLLRVLERAEVRRVGGDRPKPVDVRVLSATRRDLDREVQVGRFRDDLFHRLMVARIELPPLRRRLEDIPLLAHHFLQTLGGAPSGLGADVIRRWQEYAWPGNVRELRNAVARHIALGELGRLESLGPELGDDLAVRAGGPIDSPGDDPSRPAPADDVVEKVLALHLPLIAARQRVVDDFERRYIRHVLANHGGNVSRAAEASGIARRHFQRLRARGQTQ